MAARDGVMPANPKLTELCNLEAALLRTQVVLDQIADEALEQPGQSTCHTETDHPWAVSAVEAARGLLAAAHR